MTKCARCGHTENCQVFTLYAVQLCETCVDLIIAEWNIRRVEAMGVGVGPTAAELGGQG